MGYVYYKEPMVGSIHKCQLVSVHENPGGAKMYLVTDEDLMHRLINKKDCTDLDEYAKHQEVYELELEIRELNKKLEKKYKELK